jgi:hypothetical protein
MIRELPTSPDRDSEWSAVLVACLEALDRGEALDAERLRARYPQFAGELARFLEAQQRLDRLAAPYGRWPRRPQLRSVRRMS